MNRPYRHSIKIGKGVTTVDDFLTSTEKLKNLQGGGISTIDINKDGKIFKIRIIE